MPATKWLRTYRWGDWLRTDVIAGISVAALLIPESLAYAGIAGVPPEVGLYAAPLALIGYVIFGRSGLLVVATSSSVAAVSAAVVGDITTDEGAFVAYTAALAVVSGLVYLAAGLLRLGWIANFLSKAVLEGFIVGLSISIMIGQLDELLGIELEGENAITELLNALSQVGDWDGLTVAVGALSLIVLFGLERFAPRIPGALTAVVLAIVAVSVLDLAEEGLLIVGEIPTGLPEFGLPDIEWSDLSALLIGSLAIVLIGFSEAYAAATDIAKKTGDRIDADQELIAYGVSNVGAGLSSGMVVAGSLSKSKANEESGAKSQLSNVVNALVVLLTLLFLAALFENLPLATLAAVVIHALWKSSDPRKLAPFWRMNRFDFWLGVTTLVAVLLFDTLPAVVIGVVLSLAVLIYRISFPRSVELGRDPDTGEFEDLELHPDAERVPGVCVYRFDAPLIYSNAAAFVNRARRMVRASDPTPHTFVVDGEVMSRIDSTGLEALTELVDLMESADIEVVLARFHERAAAEIARMPELDDNLLENMSHRPAQAAILAQEQRQDRSDDGPDPVAE